MSRLDPVFKHRLHAGQVEFITERFERSAESYGDNMQGVRLESDDGNTVCDNNDYYPAETDPELIKRIIACLQYCHGMSTDELEKQNALMGTKR